MTAGMIAQIISSPRGDCGTGAAGPASVGGANAARNIASSATMQSAAAIQKIGSDNECSRPAE